MHNISAKWISFNCIRGLTRIRWSIFINLEFDTLHSWSAVFMIVNNINIWERCPEWIDQKSNINIHLASLVDSRLLLTGWSAQRVAALLAHYLLFCLNQKRNKWPNCSFSGRVPVNVLTRYRLTSYLKDDFDQKFQVKKMEHAMSPSLLFKN